MSMTLNAMPTTNKLREIDDHLISVSGLDHNFAKCCQCQQVEGRLLRTRIAIVFGCIPAFVDFGVGFGWFGMTDEIAAADMTLP